MLLNKSWSTIFVFVFIYFVNASENESDTESDEDDKLKQALVLVEILKKEYLKLLQSQHVVQQQLQQLQQQQPQDLELATTTVSPPDVNDTTQEVEPENHAAAARYLRRMGSGQEISGLLNGRRANKVPIDKVWNKKFLANYRRALSEPVNGTTENTNMTDANKGNDPVNMAPNKTENVTLNTKARNTKEKQIRKATVNKIKNVTKSLRNKKRAKNSVKKLKSPAHKNKPVLRDGDEEKKDAAEGKPEGKEKDAAEAKTEDKGKDAAEAKPGDKGDNDAEKTKDNADKEKNATDVKPDDNADKGKNATEVEPDDNADKGGNATEVTNKDSGSKKKNSTEVTKDPVKDQIASELDNELKEEGITKALKKKSRTTPITQKKFLSIKPTLRIHLARSTRLPLPLSENNAYCYYVPHSPLCANGR